MRWPLILVNSSRFRPSAVNSLVKEGFMDMRWFRSSFSQCVFSPLVHLLTSSPFHPQFKENSTYLSFKWLSLYLKMIPPLFEFVAGINHQKEAEDNGLVRFHQYKAPSITTRLSCSISSGSMYLSLNWVVCSHWIVTGTSQSSFTIHRYQHYSFNPTDWSLARPQSGYHSTL